jgi:hypothetical protein
MVVVLCVLRATKSRIEACPIAFDLYIVEAEITLHQHNENHYYGLIIIILILITQEKGMKCFNLGNMLGLGMVNVVAPFKFEWIK